MSPWLKRGSWYAREVHRCAIDHWQHGGMSLRPTAERMRSFVGKQERYLLWRPLDEAPPADACCHLSASTVQRWLDQAGAQAEKSVAGPLAGIVETETAGTDGLWVRLRGGGKRVVVVDSVTGVVFPPVVASGAESARSWQPLFARAQQAGLALDQLRGVTRDGAQGLVKYLCAGLAWVRVVLAGFPPPAQSWSQPRLRAATGAGHTALGGLSQLHACSRKVRTQTRRSSSRSQSPRCRRLPTAEDLVSRCAAGLVSIALASACSLPAHAPVMEMRDRFPPDHLLSVYQQPFPSCQHKMEPSLHDPTCTHDKTWTSLTASSAIGWSEYVNYGANNRAWHSIPYGWSAWLQPAAPVQARYVRFH